MRHNNSIGGIHGLEPQSFFIHSPSIPMTLKSVHNGTHSNVWPRPLAISSHPTSEDSVEQRTIHEKQYDASEISVLFYIGVVLVLYICALVALLSRYRRSERTESRLTRLYDDFLRKDFQRIPKKEVEAPEIPARVRYDYTEIATDTEEFNV